MKLKHLMPLPFTILALVYGVYKVDVLPIFVGVLSTLLYLPSLKSECEEELVLCGSVALFSSVLSIWGSWIKYLSLLGVLLLLLLQLSTLLRR
ncbi:hypothetical protein [Thermococcus sp.]|uniref:hypothetical protein n=1 Tax=Thermococcus sp. TaxID=35749 RepID=UPI0025F10A24|nr:hypothetical protein [Thermococcus sp.]